MCYMGPYSIVTMKRNKTAYCCSLATQNIVKCHVERLKPYYGTAIMEQKSESHFSPPTTENPLHDSLPQTNSIHSLHTLDSLHSFASADSIASGISHSARRSKKSHINRHNAHKSTSDSSDSISDHQQTHDGHHAFPPHSQKSVPELISYSNSILDDLEAPAAGEDRPANIQSQHAHSPQNSDNTLSESEISTDTVSDSEEIKALKLPLPAADAYAHSHKMRLRNRANLKKTNKYSP
jgi:hypothetical protein